VFKLGSGRYRNNIQLGVYGGHRSNVWAYATGPGFGRAISNPIVVTCFIVALLSTHPQIMLREGRRAVHIIRSRHSSKPLASPGPGPNLTSQGLRP
jgi:hypothetical protein